MPSLVGSEMCIRDRSGTHHFSSAPCVVCDRLAVDLHRCCVCLVAEVLRSRSVYRGACLAWWLQETRFKAGSSCWNLSIFTLIAPVYECTEHACSRLTGEVVRKTSTVVCRSRARVGTPTPAAFLLSFALHVFHVCCPIYAYYIHGARSRLRAPMQEIHFANVLPPFRHPILFTIPLQYDLLAEVAAAAL